LIDRAGRVRSPTAQYIPDCIVDEMQLGSGDEATFFVRHGMYFGRLCTVLIGALLLCVPILDWRNRRARGGLSSFSNSERDQG
jgi:hypothetical protein